jgi:F-type H+-transporting ATPase subunit gamma
MPSLKALRKRIKTVENTRQITRAMKAVAVSKLRRVQEMSENTKRYSTALSRIVGQLLAAAPDVEHPLRRRTAEPRMVTIVLVTADRGMCGAFNNHAIEKANHLVKELGERNVELYCIGKKGRDFARRRNLPLVAAHIDGSGKIDVELVSRITDELTTRFAAGLTDRVVVAHNVFVNMMRYTATTFEFLPLDPATLLADQPADDGARREYIFEPDAAEVFSVTLARYLRVRLVSTLATTYTAEHAARMIAMTNAADNCEELLTTLTLQRNKARQASITKELLEIVSGAEALKG